MRNSNTVDSLRLRETIADFELTLNSLGFKKPPNKEFGEIDAETVQVFLKNKIRQQNQEYSQQASQKGGAAHQKPSDLFGFTSDNKATQINNLLEQAVHNQGKGSFKSRNASAYTMAISRSKEAISKLGKSLSLTSISSGGNHPQQQKSTLQKSQSLSTQHTDQKVKETQSRSGHKNLKKSNPIKTKPLIRKKPLVKILSDFFTFEKTKIKTQSGTSRALAKPNKVNPQSNSNTSSSRNSSFASSRSGTSQNSQLSNRSQSFNGEPRSQQSIASRNQSLSRSRGDSSRGNSFSSQGSLGSRSSSDSKTSRVNQSRSGGKNSNNSGR
jgi:hypothetical protein